MIFHNKDQANQTEIKTQTTDKTWKKKKKSDRRRCGKEKKPTKKIILRLLGLILLLVERKKLAKSKDKIEISKTSIKLLAGTMIKKVIYYQFHQAKKIVAISAIFILIIASLELSIKIVL